jgi:hypothetical protein
MKISLEKMFLIIFIIALSLETIYFVSPGPDIYVHYLTAKEIVKDPSFLWRTNLIGWQNYRALQSSAFTGYPPLIYFLFGFLLIISMPLFIATIISIIAIIYFLYKIDGKAIPFLFLSFMFIREIAFSGNDIIMVAVTFVSFYFLMQKKLITSAIFAGITPLMKSSGFFILLSWFLAMLYFERKRLLTKYFILAIIIAFLIPFPWYFRNYMIFGNIYLAIIGQSSERYQASLEHLSSTFQMSQPERFLWDSTSYYPLPIDILFYVGLLFFAYNLIKKRKVETYTILVIILAGVYFIIQLSGNPFFVIRHEMIIFPFLALEILKGIPEKYLKYSFIICLAFFIYFSFNLPKYAFNQYSDTIVNPACKEIKTAIDSEPVYVNAFHNWFIIYKCNLNATNQADSKWTIDFENGQLYLTNKTNLTNNITGV